MKRWLPEPRKRISLGLDEEQTRLLWRPAEEIKMWMDVHNIREKKRRQNLDSLHFLCGIENCHL